MIAKLYNPIDTWKLRLLLAYVNWLLQLTLRIIICCQENVTSMTFASWVIVAISIYVKGMKVCVCVPPFITVNLVSFWPLPSSDSCCNDPLSIL